MRTAHHPAPCSANAGASPAPSSARRTREPYDCVSDSAPGRSAARPAGSGMKGCSRGPGLGAGERAARAQFQNRGGGPVACRSHAFFLTFFPV
jgi:hypothetical protein